MSTENIQSALPSQVEIKAFEHFMSLVVSTMLRAQNKRIDFLTMPPLCGAYKLDGESPSLVGFDALYRDYVQFCEIKLNDKELETWVRRTRDKYPSNVDFICFAFVAADINSKSNNNILLLSAVAKTNQCFSITLPIHDKVFENTNYLDQCELIVGYRNGVVPFYGNFSDISH